MSSGSVPPNYEAAGKAAYEAYVVAMGWHDETPWSLLPFFEQHAWCEAARCAVDVSG